MQLTIQSGSRLIERIIHFVRAEFGPLPISCFGSSYGATAIIAANGIQNLASSMVFRSPVSDYVAVREAQLGEEGIERWKRDGVSTELISRGRPSPYTFFEEAKQVDLYRKAQAICVPLLLVQGSQDTTVPLEHSHRLKSCWGGPCEIVVIQGGDHSLNADEHMKMFCALSCDWIVRKFVEVAEAKV